MDIAAWLLAGIFLCLVGELIATIFWLRSWASFQREYRDSQEAMKRLLLQNFSELLDGQRQHNEASPK